MKLHSRKARGYQAGSSPLMVDQFDSELWLPDAGARTAAELRIFLYIDLVQKDPPAPTTTTTPDGLTLSGGGPMPMVDDANHHAFAVQAWGVGQAKGAPALATATDNWGAFQQKVVSVATTFWDKRLWLRPPFGCTALRVGKWAPNVLCRFQCALADDTHPAHIHIDCWRLAFYGDKDAFTPEVHLYHNFIAETAHPVLQPIPKVIPTQKTVDHLRVAHEIGHAIGEHHSAEDVAGCVGDPQVYGQCTNALPWMPLNIMGSGNDLYAPFNAKPWIRCAQDHTGCYNPSAGAGPDDAMTSLTSWQANLIDAAKGFTQGQVWDV
jgi:hypothetical protein